MDGPKKTRTQPSTVDDALKGIEQMEIGQEYMDEHGGGISYPNQPTTEKVRSYANKRSQKTKEMNRDA